jgi:hypothetical protein
LPFEWMKEVNILGGGRNVDDQNVDRPKISERRNGLFSWSERRHHNVENVFWVDHYYDDQNVENSTFDVLIFCDAIGKFRTSKCFLTKETFDVLIFCDAIGKFRTSKWILWKFRKNIISMFWIYLWRWQWSQRRKSKFLFSTLWPF